MFISSFTQFIRACNLYGTSEAVSLATDSGITITTVQLGLAYK